MWNDPRKNLSEIAKEARGARIVNRRLSFLTEHGGLFLTGLPNFRQITGITGNFLIFCQDSVTKYAVYRILTGKAFREYGIENFLVEDFFSWVMDPRVSKDGHEAVNIILKGLERYDLTKLNEDIFKELYQQLVDPAERHDLGEFYTPDWLAGMIVGEVVASIDSRVLDPACGSGTFLAETIRKKLSLMSSLDLKPSKKVRIVIQTVYGMDVHPLAVLISKANYLLALGEYLIKKGDPIFIPVYMADSIIFPSPTPNVESSEPNEKTYSYEVDKDIHLILPESLIEAESADGVIDAIKDYATQRLLGSEFSASAFQNYLGKAYGVTKEQFNVILTTADKLVILMQNNKDIIHAFILKNIYKPSTIGKFDIIVGNPPWLSYRDVKTPERQKELKGLVIEKYKLLRRSEHNLFTQMEMATLFFVRCVDIYLKDYGKIAFVLPRSIFTGDQHKNFRENNYPVDCRYLMFPLLRPLGRSLGLKTAPNMVSLA